MGSPSTKGADWKHLGIPEFADYVVFEAMPSPLHVGAASSFENGMAFRLAVVAFSGLF